jgi:hypothetical protein
MTRQLILRIAFPILLAIMALTAYVVYALALPMNMAEHCGTGFETIAVSTSEAFRQCQIDSAKRFVDGHYAETKDLAKAFFSLTTAILVLSLTFSDKVVDVVNATEVAFRATLSCWLLLLASLLLTGGSLSIYARAATIALESPWTNYRDMVPFATVLLSLAVLIFALGLGALIFGGMASLLDKRRRARLPIAG